MRAIRERRHILHRRGRGYNEKKSGGDAAGGGRDGAEGTFVLADIGGYTKFLTGVGITHAKETIEHLLNRLIERKDKRWKVANVMGDCVFFYSETPEAAASTFRLLRGLHEEFQDAQLDIASGSTCRCGACDRTEDLSLKFVVHAGPFEVQNIGGRKELIGQDIIVATAAAEELCTGA